MCAECSSVRESMMGDYMWGAGPCELSVSSDLSYDDDTIFDAMNDLPEGWETRCNSDCAMMFQDFEELCSDGECMDPDFVHGGASKACNGNTCDADEIYDSSDVSSSHSFPHKMRTTTTTNVTILI